MEDLTDKMILPEIDENLWQTQTGLNEETLCGAIETIIFMSDKPISLQKIKNSINENIPLRILHQSISRLTEEYERSHHGIRLSEVAEGHQFRTKASFTKYVHDLFKVNSLVLGPTALEVLAIIAYKRPISKAAIENIRGIDSSHIVRMLMDRRLVKMSGRSEEAGRPTLYVTTNEFLEVFNLKDLTELPPEHELESLSKINEIGKISDIKSLIGTKVRAKFDFDEIEEIDDLTKSIRAISADTPFTKSLRTEEKRKIGGEEQKEGERVVTRSAFDVLEDYLSIENIKKENVRAAKSETLTSVASPTVVKIAPAAEPLYPVTPIEDNKEELSQAIDEAFSRLTQNSENLEDMPSLDKIDQLLSEKEDKIAKIIQSNL